MLSRQTYQDEFIRIVVESVQLRAPVKGVTHKDIFSIYTKGSNGEFNDLRATYPTASGRDRFFFQGDFTGIKKTTLYSGEENGKRVYRTILASYSQVNKLQYSRIWLEIKLDPKTLTID